MDLRALTPMYSVSAQIELADLAAIKAAGYAVIIDNRPDTEIPEALHTEQMRARAEALGLEFIANPVIGGAITMQNVTRQAEVLTQAQAPVLAYCASGNRSSVVWALANAGKVATDDLIAIPARFGYNLEPFRAQLDALAASQS